MREVHEVDGLTSSPDLVPTKDVYGVAQDQKPANAH